MDGHFAYECIGFGATHDHFAYEFIVFWFMDGSCSYTPTRHQDVRTAWVGAKRNTPAHSNGPVLDDEILADPKVECKQVLGRQQMGLEHHGFGENPTKPNTNQTTNR